MAIPAINVLGNPNVTEGNFQIAIEDLRKSVIGSGKAYDSVNTYSQYDTCVYGGIVYYSKINSNIGNTPAVNANWGLIGDLFNLLITNGTAFGYGAGSGGAVTQLTSKTTTATLNKPTGQIIMNNAALAAGAIVQFNLLNSLVSPTDCIEITLRQSSSIVPLLIELTWAVENGLVQIGVRNNHSSALGEALVLNFAIIKGANA